MVVHLTVDDLVDRARQITGLSDLGDDWFVDPLTHLVAFINRDAGLPSPDALPVHMIVAYIGDRLKLADYLKRHPKVRDEKVDVAAVILSARGGSTLLQRLLGTSSRLTSPRFWELVTPVPLPDEAGDPSRRIDMGRAAVDAYNTTWPEFKAIHPQDYLAYDEEILLMDRAFISQMYVHYFNIPTYNAWERTLDHTRAYEDLYLWLQLLQYQSPDRRGRKWLLKSVQHILSGGLETMLQAFPNAKAIMTHRSLDEVISSFCSVQTLMSRPANSSTFDKRNLGERTIEIYRQALADYAAARNANPSRFIDVQYRDMLADPIGQFRRTLDLIGLHPTDDDVAAASAWMARNGRETHPRHEHHLEDYGITADRVAAVFADYHAAFVK